MSPSRARAGGAVGPGAVASGMPTGPRSATSPEVGHFGPLGGADVSLSGPRGRLRGAGGRRKRHADRPQVGNLAGGWALRAAPER